MILYFGEMGIFQILCKYPLVRGKTVAVNKLLFTRSLIACTAKQLRFTHECLKRIFKIVCIIADEFRNSSDEGID